MVPSQQLDVLDPSLRTAIENSEYSDADADDFIVWSDDGYGDTDNDTLPEFPVSRIPDARRADVLFNALNSPLTKVNTKFGVRNIHRPFAESVFPILPGSGKVINISEDFSPAHVIKGSDHSVVYFMLHGSDHDGTSFWGETEDGDSYLAVTIDNIPGAVPGSIVFSGCCWGALTVSPIAARKQIATPITPKSPENSIALAYLKSGALAFIGCTGSHYSPGKSPYNFYGKPMHDHFWKKINLGKKPAEALFLAKQEYAKEMPHGLEDIYSHAIEMKILRQFTCLGLGW